MSKQYLPEQFHEWENGICIQCGAAISDVRANSIKVPITPEDVAAIANEPHQEGGESWQGEQ
jgi:hypothetical protein